MLPPPSLDRALDRYLEAPDVHEENREKGGGTAAVVLLALVLAFCHAMVMIFVVAGDMPWLALLAHLILVVATAAIARNMIVEGKDSRFLMMLLVTSAVTGIFGAVGTLVAIILHRIYTRSSQSFDEWFASIFPRDEQTDPERVYENIVSGRDEAAKRYSVIPFMEVMGIGSEAQKREAISKMTTRFHPSFAPVFRTALRDESNSIRVQAATAIARIENIFLTRQLRLNEARKRHPSDAALTLALAEFYDAYAFTGILDVERERENREKALQFYMDYLRLAPRDQAVRLKAGRLLLRAGEYQRAAEWFADCLQGGMRGEQLIGWYAEALYASGNFAELRRVASQSNGLVDSFKALQPQLAESIALWGNPLPTITLGDDYAERMAA